MQTGHGHGFSGFVSAAYTIMLPGVPDQGVNGPSQRVVFPSPGAPQRDVVFVFAGRVQLDMSFLTRVWKSGPGFRSMLWVPEKGTRPGDRC